MKIIEESLKQINCPEQVKVDVESSLEDEFLWIDSDQMVNILIELEKNSLEAMQSGGVLKITVKDDGKEKLFLSISDTGTGIREEDINYLLEPFFTTKPADEGMGLGLPLAYAFVKSHHGSISIESNADSLKGATGTTVKILLPRSQTFQVKESRIILHDD